MNKVAYILRLPEIDREAEIERVPFTEPKGVSWREAKKRLRSYYLNEAAKLRQITEKEYFNDDPVPQ